MIGGIRRGVFGFFMVGLASALTATASRPAGACSLDPAKHDGIFPENSLEIPESAFESYAVDRETFRQLIDRLTEVYAPIFASRGQTLKIYPMWKAGTVNAFAFRLRKLAQVYAFGGLARYPNMTADAYTMVLCHEIGHHLGGVPKIEKLFGLVTMSNEGEADYFASLKCARAVWNHDDNAAIVRTLSVPEAVRSACGRSFDAAADVALCERSAMAGKTLAEILASLGKTPAPSFETPDLHIAKKTVMAHPPAQCRLDTYFAGAVCEKSKDIPLSDENSSVGACSQERGETVGVRPRCWYRPSTPGGIARAK